MSHLKDEKIIDAHCRRALKTLICVDTTFSLLFLCVGLTAVPLLACVLLGTSIMGIRAFVIINFLRVHRNKPICVVRMHGMVRVNSKLRETASLSQHWPLYMYNVVGTVAAVVLLTILAITLFVIAVFQFAPAAYWLSASTVTICAAIFVHFTWKHFYWFVVEQPIYTRLYNAKRVESYAQARAAHAVEIALRKMDFACSRE